MDMYNRKISKEGGIRMSKERPTMAEMPYHFGIKMRCYPSTKQMQMIQKGIDASRFTYNEMVARNQDAYDCVRLSEASLDPWFLFRTKDRFWEFWRHRGQLNDVNHRGEWKDMPLYAQTLTRLVKLPLMKTYYKNCVKTQRVIKESYDWLQNKMIHNSTLSTAMKSYSAAWNLWRKANKGKIGTPRFKRKDWFGAGTMQLSNSYASNQPIDMYSGYVKVLDNKHVQLPKLGRIRVSHLAHFMNSHNGNVIRIGTVTVSKDNLGQHWVSFQLGSKVPFVKSFKKTNSQLGIDLNTDNFLTDSNGNVVENPKFYRTAEKYLKNTKRKLSRRYLRAKKEKRSLRNSKNYLKQRLLVAKKMKRISNRRNSFLDNLSLALIKNHDLVVAENLQSKNMLKNHALAKSIADVGWRTFIQKSTYKSELYGKTFLAIDPKNTTQTCNDCGYVMGSDDKSERLSLRNREWTCLNCGEFHIRDHNAAKNILQKGQLALA